ncbi:MAG: hypothetical protein ACREPE_01600 [Lysobacter sp.]
MTPMSRSFVVLTVGVAFVSLLAVAQPARQDTRVERAGPDIPPRVAQRRLSTASVTPKRVAAAAAPTVEDVGDPDSFGRAVRWLGVTDMRVELAASCPGGDPDAGCQVLAPAPASTAFAFDDLGRINLPARATHSLLCYWLSPALSVSYTNASAVPVIARLRYSPTLTVENPVLATAGLIDPTTGLPFAGRLLTSMTASESFEVPLPAGGSINERSRDSAVCIAGFLSRRTLIDMYGLTAAQAREFFQKPTTVRLNISGSAQHVDSAQLYFGFRIVGD